MSKTLNTRIQQKHDFEVNWNQATGFIPYAGEVIIYDPEVDDNGNFLTIDGKTASLPSGRTEGYTTSRIKIGDGIHRPFELEFVSSTEGTVPVTQGGTGATTAAQARTNLGVTPANIGAVPTSRTVNGKALSSDITITASDIGAAPAYTYGTNDLTAGTSALETGKLYFVYE